MKRTLSALAAALLLAGCAVSTGTSTGEEPTKTDTPTSEEPAAEETPAGPELTKEQQNAVESAKSYLDFQAFSRVGLIRQLSSKAGDGYSKKDATIAVDSLDVDWNAQAVAAAKSYLDFQAFSKAGLIQQLESSAGDGFTHKQAVYGATQALKD